MDQWVNLCKQCQPNGLILQGNVLFSRLFIAAAMLLILLRLHGGIASWLGSLLHVG